ncbi:hypothetical protein LCGC14_0451620 [marine sediment metagenome]|uniref:PsbP C-terminal domain-containing protein n=1 Tax=marine sediment metagenome TaxID=412755 RepID=A0A0F9SN53_9ZZZZ|nr:hypothetical protein [Phycisphaerae bacterium]HDZ43192.1 hypothetical protein [Phycisphaerae bacterium]
MRLTNRKWIIAMCTVVFIAALSTAEDADKAAEGQYRDETNGFTITPPTGWTTKQAGVGQVFFHSPLESKTDGFSENINIIVGQADKLPDLESFKKAMTAGMEAVFENFTFIEAAVTNVNGMKAIRTVFTFTMKKFTIKSVQYMIIKDGKSFTITGTALADTYETYLTAFEATVGTLQIDKAE